MSDTEGLGPCPRCQAVDSVVGCQVHGVYDGILFWECVEDGTRWHRWPEGHYLRERAEKAIEGLARWRP